MASPRVIALDLGGTKLLSGVVDDEGVVRQRVVSATDTSSEDALLAQVEAAVEGLLENDVAAIGIGVPSTIDQRKGEAIDSVNIPLTDVPLRDRLRERFGIPTAIDNDGNAAALAEYRYGAGPFGDCSYRLAFEDGRLVGEAIGESPDADAVVEVSYRAMALVRAGELTILDALVDGKVDGSIGVLAALAGISESPEFQAAERATGRHALALAALGDLSAQEVAREVMRELAGQLELS